MMAGPLANLRRLAAAREPQGRIEERCELCGDGIPAEHRHLLEPATRGLVCACQACALLFGGSAAGRYRVVPSRVLALAGFVLDEGLWDALQVPVRLVFFTHDSRAGRVVALYPSPAGPTESQLALRAWSDLEAANPVLAELEPDVEALLVNHVGGAADHLVVPIDECYRLVGLVRTNWRGLTGGASAWREVEAFFAGLRTRARTVGRAPADA